MILQETEPCQFGLAVEHVRRLEGFLAKVRGETYPEAPSELHTAITRQMLDLVLGQFPLAKEARILDVGCGQGVALELLAAKGMLPLGVALNPEDVRVCQQKGFQVYAMDQSFLDFDGGQFDLLWCRHCLEHSVFPYYTLHEFHRVLKPLGLLYVEVPAPDTSCCHQANRNHYSVLGRSLWLELFVRSGFFLLKGIDLAFTAGTGPDAYWAFILQKQ